MPTWATAVVFLEKLNGDARRCVDYQPVSGVTKVPSYPVAANTSSARRSIWQTLLFDLLKAYWQIEFELAF